MDEQWKKIKNFNYQISNLGRVRDLNGNFIKFELKNDHIVVDLYSDITEKYYPVSIIKLLKNYFNKTDSVEYVGNFIGDIKNETWKDVKGYEGIYKVSNMGRVKVIYQTKEKILKQHVNKNKGVYYIHLHKNGTKEKYATHRLVAQTFLKKQKNMNTVKMVVL